MKSAIAIIASLVLLANTCAAVMSASTNPVLQYNTSIKFTPNNYQGLYSSGDGTSPFIMLGTDSVHAIAPASGNVIARRTFAGGLKTDTNVVPVVGADGSGDSVFVVALPDGTLMAWSASDLTQKWKYAAAPRDTCHSPSGDKSCSAAAMNFLGAKSCAATGGRALTFLFCEINEAAPGSRKCSWHSIDAATGVECTAAKNLEGVQFIDNVNSFSPQKQNFTTIVSVQNTNMLGVDASTGDVVFSAPVSPDHYDGDFVIGTFNGTFALTSKKNPNGRTSVHIHSLDSGALINTITLDAYLFAPTFSFSWTPLGHLSFTGQVNHSSVFALVSAQDGDLVKLYQHVHNTYEIFNPAFYTAGKAFLLGTQSTYWDTTVIYTFNVMDLQDNNVFQLKFPTGFHSVGANPLSPFRMVDGAEAVVAVNGVVDVEEIELAAFSVN